MIGITNNTLPPSPSEGRVLTGGYLDTAEISGCAVGNPYIKCFTQAAV
jgi:hypothetical protein